MRTSPLLVISRVGQIRPSIPIIDSLKALGQDPKVLLVHGDKTGSKAHLNFDSSSAPSELMLRCEVLHSDSQSIHKLDALGRITYFSFETPGHYIPWLKLPVGGWVQVQNGGGDVLISHSKSKLKSDLFLLWGRGWASKELENSTSMLPVYRQAVSEVRNTRYFEIGNLNLVNTGFTGESQAERDHLHFFEPHIITGSGNALVDQVSILKLIFTKSQDLAKIRRTVRKLATDAMEDGYTLGFRSRKKTISVPLGQKPFRDHLDDSDFPNHRSLAMSRAIVSFLPSTSALEAMLFGVKVFQLDSRPLIPSTSENSTTPNHAMYQLLRAELPNSIHTLEGTEFEFSELVNAGQETNFGEVVDVWSKREVDLKEVLSEALSACKP